MSDKLRLAMPRSEVSSFAVLAVGFVQEPLVRVYQGVAGRVEEPESILVASPTRSERLEPPQFVE